MQQLHHLLFFLVLPITGCNKVHKIGIHQKSDQIEESVRPSLSDSDSEQSDIFVTSEGHLVSFAQEDGCQIAIVDKKLLKGFKRRVKLLVYLEEGFYLETLSNKSREQQKKLVHILKTSDGQDIVYVGREGLPEGGIVQNLQCKYHIAGDPKELG